MTKHTIRPLLAGTAFATALVLSGCAVDPYGGYRPMNQAASGSADGVSFNQANAECWERSMSLLGGVAMDSARQRAYDTCMNDRGWYDPRLPAPRPRGATTPSGR
jgi:hypothetical protein